MRFDNLRGFPLIRRIETPARASKRLVYFLFEGLSINKKDWNFDLRIEISADFSEFEGLSINKKDWNP